MDLGKLQIKVNTKIKKYGDGSNLETDAPIEEVTKEVILEGSEALQLLQELGGVDNGSN